MFGETVTRIRTGTSPGDDRYGNPLPGSDVESAIPGAAFDPEHSVEPDEVGRTSVVSTPALLFYGTRPDLVPSDRVRVRGLVYEVQGRPGDYRSPWTGFGGLIVRLELVEG